MLCIICGASRDEVEGMFCFPLNAKRSRVWQETLGMVYHPDFCRKNRICSRHFGENSFRPDLYGNGKSLKRDSIPNPWPMKSVDLAIAEPSGTSTNYDSCNTNLVMDISSSDNIDVDEVEPTQSPVCDKGTLKKHEHSALKEIKKTATSREKALLNVIRKREGHIKKLKMLCKSRRKQLKQFQYLKNPEELCNNILKGIPSHVANFIISQIHCTNRSPRGRRWTLDDKIMALAVYKKSPKCYAFLRRLLALPSKSTLLALLESIPFNVGINEQLFMHLAECLNKFEENERLCTLVFDEMAIRELQYNCKEDLIQGVEDFGEERSKNIANYVLVFMVQGVVKKWKQPLAYYFSRGRVNSTKLGDILKNVLHTLFKYNVPVLATVCDMGTANVKTLKDMGASVENPYFVLDNKKVFTIFDVPHLLKCTRNLFVKHDVLVPANDVLPSFSQPLIATFADIVKAYEEDKNNPLIFRSLHKLKDFYLSPLRLNALKVKIAAQTLSRTVSVYLYCLVKHGTLPSRAIATASFINDVDEIFDSCNGNSLVAPEGKPFRSAVTAETGHVLFWKTAFDKIRSWRFIRDPAIITELLWKPLSQKGWLQTLQGFIHIWEHLQSIGVTVLKPQYLNLDSLENLFGAIRSGCGSNKNPTATQFIGSFKTQVINGLTKQCLQKGNCEEDDFSLLSDLRSFLTMDVTLEEEAM